MMMLLLVVVVLAVVLIVAVCGGNIAVTATVAIPNHEACLSCLSGNTLAISMFTPPQIHNRGRERERSKAFYLYKYGQIGITRILVLSPARMSARLALCREPRYQKL